MSCVRSNARIFASASEGKSTAFKTEALSVIADCPLPLEKAKFKSVPVPLFAARATVTSQCVGKSFSCFAPPSPTGKTFTSGSATLFVSCGFFIGKSLIATPVPAFGPGAPASAWTSCGGYPRCAALAARPPSAEEFSAVEDLTDSDAESAAITAVAASCWPTPFGWEDLSGHFAATAAGVCVCPVVARRFFNGKFSAVPQAKSFDVPATAPEAVLCAEATGAFLASALTVAAPRFSVTLHFAGCPALSPELKKNGSEKNAGKGEVSVVETIGEPESGEVAPAPFAWPVAVSSGFFAEFSTATCF